MSISATSASEEMIVDDGVNVLGKVEKHELVTCFCHRETD